MIIDQEIREFYETNNMMLSLTEVYDSLKYKKLTNQNMTLEEKSIVSALDKLYNIFLEPSETEEQFLFSKKLEEAKELLKNIKGDNSE
jgi:hypothetical protein